MINLTGIVIIKDMRHRDFYFFGGNYGKAKYNFHVFRPAKS